MTTSFTTCPKKKSCLILLSWLWKILALPFPSRTLEKLPEVNLSIWVDTLTSWGIGFCVNDAWAAWHLLEGWKTASRDISWAELIAIELAVLWLTQSGWQNTCLKIHCDHTSVIASFWKGHSQNPACNESLSRITTNLTARNLSIVPTYVQSAIIKADPLSWGLLGTADCHIHPHILIPQDL